MLADDVGVAHRLQELLGPVEVVDADHHAPESLGDVAVGAGARDDPVLGGEALGLLVERGQRDPRVEHLEDVDLLDHVEQVLVVGHRVEAVERVRDVDEPALAADLGDRLCHRHPLRDLLLEEQPDHLALLGRLHLLGDDHLDSPHLLRHLARRQRTGDLVVVGDRDRAEAALPRGLQQHLDRGRAVRRVVGVHVEVDVDRATASRAGAARPACRRGRGGARRRAGRSPRPGRPPRPSREPRPLAPCRRSTAQAGLGDQALDLAREGDRIPGREQQAALAVADQLLVKRELRGHRHGPRRERLPHEARARRAARRRPRRGRRRPRSAPRATSRPAPGGPGRAAAARAAPRRRPAPDRRLPVELEGQAPQRAQEETQRPALLLEAEGDPHGPLGRPPVVAGPPGHQPSTSGSAPGVTSS